MDLNALSATQKLVYTLYKDRKGDPILLTPGQDFLFQTIFRKKYPRIHCMCHTRWGKSNTISLAVLTRLLIYPEKWIIVAGNKDKAKIIMDYVISHIFDNEFSRNRFMPEEKESIEDIRRYKNKNHLTFVINPKAVMKEQLLSELTIVAAGDALGKGAENIIEDESGLIDDEDHALVMRMLGDDPNKNFLIKIGNPFRRNHFLRSFRDNHYMKIVIDCYRSLVDGRMTQNFIDEMKTEPFFSVLYECKFPKENEIDEQGYMQLLLQDDITLAQQRKLTPAGIRRLGVDVARGGRNFNAYVMRGDNYAQLLGKDSEEDSVKIADRVEKYMKDYGIIPQAVFIDDTGVGHGVSSILKNRGLKINPVNFGEKASRDILLNKRAEVYAGEFGVQSWIKQGAQLLPNEGWQELLRIRYRKNVGMKTQIEPKEAMIKDGRESPDIADALALTFAKVKISVYTNTNSSTPQSVSPFGGVARFPGMPG